MTHGRVWVCCLSWDGRSKTCPPPGPGAVAGAARAGTGVPDGSATPGGAAEPLPAAVASAGGEIRWLSTAEKKSPAVRLATEPSIRCPTPPIMPPTTASAS